MRNCILLLSLATITACGEEPKPDPAQEIWEGMNPGECTDSADNDGDGAYDCDDSDCATLPDCAVTDDDGDGVITDEDCDDSNADMPNNDADCDGVLTDDDCDDGDDTSTAISEDGDCDGVLSAEDCDDGDSASTIVAEDGDCDGVLSDDDCDDADADSTVVSEDEDCDGSITSDDCNDTDDTIYPGATDIAGDFIDQDCSGADALDGNLQLVDLSDMVGDLPLVADGPTQVLWQDQDWEHSSWQNSTWPAGGNDSVGYPALAKNDHGLNPDGKYYLYYAHHDPMSGIGLAVADDIEGPYIKISDEDSQVLTVPNYNPSGPNTGDPSHFSSPVVVWNQEMNGGEGKWCMYFHYYNHYHSAWEADSTMPGAGYQMTGIATTDDLSSHDWEILEDPTYGSVSVWDIFPVLTTTNEPWGDSASSYNAILRLVDGTWLAFIRGTNFATGLTELGMATSEDGIDWAYFPENPVIGPGKTWATAGDVFRPKFIGYLGETSTGDDKYLVAWSETDGGAEIIYGTTTDFVTFERDPRGYASWGSQNDAVVSVRREGDVLYFFTGTEFFSMELEVDQ
jgi:hypothetical protein